MPPSSPKSSVTSIDTAPVSSSASSRAPLRDSHLRPVLCCAGALGIGLSLAPLALKPQDALVNEDGALRSEIALSNADTMVVAPSMPPGALLQGRIRLVAGETDALGRARVGGQVARHLVESGARVERGDAVIEISSGAARRAVPASEFRQNKAEQSQIAAAEAQSALAQKISTAETRLRVAKERVARAQQQVTIARDVVRRLQNGQSVASSEIPAPFRDADAPQSRTRRNRRERGRPDGAHQIASRQAEAAKEAAQESAQALQTTRAMLLDAQSAAREAETRVQNSAKAVIDVEARFDAKKATGADVEAARAAQKEAQSALEAADKAFAAAKNEVAKREKNASSAQAYAQSSAEQAAKTRSSAQDNEGSEGEVAPSDENLAVGSSRVTLDRAIEFAGAALDESRRASRDAERIHAEIEGYQSQVTRSNSRIEAATQDLAAAQQRVMESVPRPRFTTSYAPASGVVTWISRLAREVGAGDPVFGIARGQRTAARFEDKSGLWRAIKPGAVLSALVVNAPGLDSIDSDVAKNQLSSTIAPDALAKFGAGQRVALKMNEIEPPEGSEEAAKLSGALIWPQGGEQSVPEGAQVLVSMPRPGQKPTLSVPASALVLRGGATFIAVLSPLSVEENQARSAEQQPVSQTSVSAAPAKSEAAPDGEAFQLRWTRVNTGRSDGLRLEITAGLQAGARIVSEPEDLEAMGFLPSIKAENTLIDTNDGTPGQSKASDAATNAEAEASAPNIAIPDVVVRLTPELA